MEQAFSRSINLIVSTDIANRYLQLKVADRCHRTWWLTMSGVDRVPTPQCYRVLQTERAVGYECSF
jgi:hypothetical protein